MPHFTHEEMRPREVGHPVQGHTVTSQWGVRTRARLCDSRCRPFLPAFHRLPHRAA